MTLMLDCRRGSAACRQQRARSLWREGGPFAIRVSAKNGERYDSAKDGDGHDRDRDREAHAMTAVLAPLRFEASAALIGEMLFPMFHDEGRGVNL